MKYYVKNRKKPIRANDAKSLVKKLRMTDRQRWKSNLEYMHAYAERRFMFDRLIISWRSEEEFVQSLQKNKLIKTLNANTFFKKLMFWK